MSGIEKSGAQELIGTEPSLVTEHSLVLPGDGDRPASLRDSLVALGNAFRLPGALLSLAQSLRGRWKTGLFLGSADVDRWVGASVHVDPPDLTASERPHIAFLPRMPGHSDAVTFSEQLNVVLCPVPHDGSFIQIFRDGWRIVQTLCVTNFEMPDSSHIPSPLHREVARIFAERRNFPIMEVVEATRKFAQPELLTSTREVVSNVPVGTNAPAATSTIITPIARTLTAPAGRP